MSQDWPIVKKYRDFNDSIIKAEVYPDLVSMVNFITES